MPASRMIAVQRATSAPMKAVASAGVSPTGSRPWPRSSRDHGGGFERAVGLGVEPLDRGGRRRSGRGEAVPAGDFEARKAALGDGRQFRRERRALGRRHRQRLELAGGGERQARDRRRKHHVDLPAEEIGHRRRGALVGHVQKIDPRLPLEELAGEMDGGTRARRGIGHLPGMGFRKRDEVGGRGERRARIHHQHIGAGRRGDDTGEIAHRIERQVAVEAGHRGEPAVRQQQGVAVGARMGRRLHADDAAGAAAIVDHDGGAEVRRQRLAEHARHGIDRAARRERHDEADRALGIGGRCRPRHQRAGAGEAGQEFAAGEDHAGTRRHLVTYPGSLEPGAKW